MTMIELCLVHMTTKNIEKHSVLLLKNAVEKDKDPRRGAIEKLVFTYYIKWANEYLRNT